MKDLVKQILVGHDPSIRFEVLERFPELADCESDIQFLIDILQNDHDPCVRHEAAAQLYRIEEKKPQLMANLRPRVVSALFERAWNDESVVVRHESIEVLGYIADEQSLDALRRLTTDVNLDISSTAEIALRTATRRIAEGIETRDLCSELISRWPKEQTNSLTE